MNKRILVLLLFGVLMGAMDIAVLGPVIHSIQKTFQVTSRQGAGLGEAGMMFIPCFQSALHSSFSNLIIQIF